MAHTKLAHLIVGLFYICALAMASLAGPNSARAAEGATSTYLLGFRGPMAGFTPPPGFYFENDTYFYEGKIGGGRNLATGGLVVTNVKQSTWLDLAMPIWVTPVQVLGGNLAFSATVPFGRPKLDANLVLDLPRLNRIVAIPLSDAELNFGDVYATSFVGWHSGNFHWQLGATAMIPTGTYQDGQLSNVSLNRPAADLFGTVTWLDPTIGIDLSAAMGVTFNGKNSDTDYKTGTEFHLEWAAMKFFSKEFAAGLVGYYYDQLSGDSGTGARLGPFKGRVLALGGAASWTFPVGAIPVTTRLKVYREFETENRFEGTTGFISIVLPLHVDAPPAPSAGKRIVTK
jgi:hypothetical protein